MRKLEAFLSLRVVTCVVMSNHFHHLVEELDLGELPALDRNALLQRPGYLYDRSTVETVRDELDRAAARAISNGRNKSSSAIRNAWGMSPFS